MQISQLKERWSKMPSLIDLMIVVAITGIIGVQAMLTLVGIAILCTIAYLLFKLLFWGVRALLAIYSTGRGPSN